MNGTRELYTRRVPQPGHVIPTTMTVGSQVRRIRHALQQSFFNRSCPVLSYLRQLDYRDQGFLYLQLALDASLIHFTNKSVKIEADSIEGHGFLMRRFPHPGFVKDAVVDVLEAFFPFLLMLSFIYPVMSTTRSIVVEKERRLKVNYSKNG